MDVFQDQAFLAVVGIAVTVIVALIIYRLQKQKKSISFRILSKTSLLSVQEEIKKDLVMIYKGNPVKQVQLIILKIVCSGNIPIKYEDYETPISINLGKDTHILSAQILEKKPDDLEISVWVKNNKVFLQECLLNQDDAITIKILATKIEKEIKIDGRIAGVKKIENLSDESMMWKIFSWSGMLISSISVGITIIGSSLGIYKVGTVNEPFIIMIFGLLLTIVYLYLERRNDKRLNKELELLRSK